MENKKLIDLVPGDTESICGVVIQELVLKTETFIVYLNQKNEIFWATDNYGNFPDDFGDVMNKVRELETINENVFEGKNLKSFNYLVAEGVARLLDDRKTDHAIKILEKAEQKILLHGKNKNRTVYIISSLVFTLFLTFLILLSFFFKNQLVLLLSLNCYEIITASFFGGIGAYFSVFFRSNTYEPDVSISKNIHVIDGLLRNFYGCLAGLLVALGVKSNIIMGFLNQTDKSIIVICFIALIAGASESLIPSLISQIEGKIHE